jgi:O-Antigen ligase
LEKKISRLNAIPYIANEMSTRRKSRSWFKAFLVSLLFGLSVFGFWALSPSFGVLAELASVPGEIISIVQRAFVVILALGVGLFALNQRGSYAPLLPLMLFVLIYSYRMFDNYFVENYQVYVRPSLAFLMLLGACIIPSIALYVSAGHFTNSESEFRKVMIGLMLVFLFGVWYNSDSLYERSTAQASLERVNQISLTSIATSFGLFAILSLRHRSWVLRGIWVACLIGLAVIVALAKARGPLVGTMVALVGYFLVVKGRYKIQMLCLLAVGAISIAALQIFFGGDLLEQALSRFDYVEDGGANDSVTLRKLAWQAAWEQFLADPIFGRLMFETALKFYPHNIALEVLMATGVVGAFFFFWHLMQTLLAAKYLMQQNIVSLPESFMVLMFFKEFIQNMFSGSVWGASGYFITSCCIMGMAQHSRSQGKAMSQHTSRLKDFHS